MATDITARLARALEASPFTDAERAALRARLDLAPNESLARLLSAMRAGRPVRADVFLAAHAVKGWNPLTQCAADADMPPPRGGVGWGYLALALRLSRMQPAGGDITGRKAAQLARVTPATWCRAEAGKPVSVPNFLALCAFLDRHPHEVCEPRFTGNAHCNARGTTVSQAAVAG